MTNDTHINAKPVWSRDPERTKRLWAQYDRQRETRKQRKQEREDLRRNWDLERVQSGNTTVINVVYSIQNREPAWRHGARMQSPCPWTSEFERKDGEAPKGPLQARKTVDVAAMVDYADHKLSGSAQKILDALIATTQLYVDWFGRGDVMCSKWFAKEIFNIPQTTAKRGIDELLACGLITVVGQKTTYRTARKKGRQTRIYELVLSTWDVGEGPYGRKISYRLRRRIRDVLRNMRIRDELEGVWRMSTPVYLKRFGPIDTERRGWHLLMRLEWVPRVGYDLEVYQHPPPPTVSSLLISPPSPGTSLPGSSILASLEELMKKYDPFYSSSPIIREEKIRRFVYQCRWDGFNKNYLSKPKPPRRYKKSKEELWLQWQKNKEGASYRRHLEELEREFYLYENERLQAQRERMQAETESSQAG